MSAAGLVLLAVYAAIAVASPVLAPSLTSADVARPLELPTAAHWLGTNDVGQDNLRQIIIGTRASLAVAVASATASAIIATLVGAIAGYVRGWPEAALMRIVDLLLTLPQLPLMIVLAAYLPPSLTTTVIVIAALGWALPARVVRAQTLAIRSENYVLAARQIGGSSRHIVRTHILPALGPILLAVFVGQAQRAVAVESGLAFLGLGDPLQQTWGSIMHAALTYRGIYFTPGWIWWLLPAGATVSVLILAFTLCGVGLEDWLDPRLRTGTRPSAARKVAAAANEH